MKILLCGDSWMHGCYQDPQILEPTHPGVQAMLVEDGHSVINLAVQGGSNELQLQKIKILFEVSSWRPDVIIFMQCPLMRRYRNYAEMNFRRTIQPDLLEYGVQKKDFNFDGNTVEKILEPIVQKLSEELKTYNAHIIIASGNTKMHPAWNNHFKHVMLSGDNLWASHKDSFFSDQDSVSRFINVVLSNCHSHNKEFKKKLMTEVIEDFNVKWDAWRTNVRWIANEHGRMRWHEEFYQQIKPILLTLPK